jgi:hypothetical protein
MATSSYGVGGVDERRFARQQVKGDQRICRGHDVLAEVTLPESCQIWNEYPRWPILEGRKQETLLHSFKSGPVAVLPATVLWFEFKADEQMSSCPLLSQALATGSA